MELAVVHSRALAGVQAPPVTVEVHLSGGLPTLSIVGLPETAVRESKERVRSAILNNNLEFPLGRITVNLAPADLPKDGGRFDLPIAIGILAASGQLPQQELQHYEFLGELALNGGLRPVRGALCAARAVRAAGRALLLPMENASEAALIRDLHLYSARHLVDVLGHLLGSSPLAPHQRAEPAGPGRESLPDLCDVQGQFQARRALEIAAAGYHNLVMIGPPGSGKTMLADRLPGILPAMTEVEALESAAVASIGKDGFDPARWRVRPLRAPHHTASAVALVGGGSNPRPGEISLAHNGVLFLDELPEFSRHVLEVLREPMESGRIVISRAANQVTYPASFLLIAAFNPCACGYFGDSSGRCRCAPDHIARYRARISGPLLDRIDMHIEVPNMTRELLLRKESTPAEASAVVRTRVQAAHERQIQRAGKANARLTASEVAQYCKLTSRQNHMLAQAIDKLGLSGRALHRILKLARTIADLEASDAIADHHLTEAIAYRKLDRRAGT
jgi:magnesium chelatase family protein